MFVPILLLITVKVGYTLCLISFYLVMMSNMDTRERYHHHTKNRIKDYLEYKYNGKFEYVIRFWSFQEGIYIYVFKQEGQKGEFLYLAYWKNVQEPTLYDQISIKDCKCLEEIEGKIWL